VAGGLDEVALRTHEWFRPIGDVSLTTPAGSEPTLAVNQTIRRTAMALNPESKYPNRRAYVLKLRGDAKPDALAGRVENLVTGQQRHFTSAQELVESLASDLEPGSADADRMLPPPAEGGAC
jgi:hypothetical protein